ncbi:hypothetical protein ASD62_10360 [Phycicoccus sp. Root563]|uniref:hypothetical protein n=1 Tax=unclassified Phycicoccus TaxID=2637926 RepID=UPI000702B8EB|nr:MULTISPECIES: hypothetical protein [unclassified Phycicoccus]KQU65224.1 hypothetical protein ASC58_17110 [Phycicoccus sp. Root101]KQZ89648.1 hypothetical protein ASD62_10360 [Phycicoccus sp. Root563]
MTRLAAAVDRVVVLVVGLVLVVVGVAGIAWQLDLVAQLPTKLDAAWATDLPEQGWWPWALGAAAVLLALVALRWIGAHAPSRKLATHPLAGSGPEGRLRIDLDALASATADRLAEAPSVRSAKGAALGGRASGAVEVTATVDSRADLGHVRTAIAEVGAELARATDGTVPARYRVRVARPERTARRLR